MRELQFEVGFRHCQVQRLEDMVHVASMLRTHGFVPAKATPGGRDQPIDDSDVATYPCLIDYRSDPEGQRAMGVQWRVMFWVHVADLPGMIASFSFSWVDEQRNTMLLGVLADFEFTDQRHYIEPAAQRLKEVGLALYEATDPVIGWIDRRAPIDMRDAARPSRPLRRLGWVNFFGAPYVEKYGKELLLGIPGHETRALPHGGVFHQLSPTFLAARKGEARDLRQQVSSYLAAHDMRVSTSAPYTIPATKKPAAPEPHEPTSFTDQDLTAYMDQILGTTLVLDDGTRVKPVPVPWEDLTEGQQELAIAAIKRAAIEEIRRPGRTRIRFEFDSIPEELNAMLADLAGRDNPDFEWVQVEME